VVILYPVEPQFGVLLMHRYIAVMKLNPEDNRVNKYQRFKPGTTLEDAEAHVAKHLAEYPDAFVYTEEDTVDQCDIACWRMDTDNRTILDRVRRETPMDDWRYAMQKSDHSLMDRLMEDYITEQGITLRPGRVKDNYDAKVALRRERP